MSSGFISEADLAERRRVRKENWQKTRGENDPEEPPDEPEGLGLYDHRSLYERLQEQKLKKEEEWEEAHKLKNMVRGLEDDEVDFLEMVDNTKLLEEKRIKAEENSVLVEYRKRVSKMQQRDCNSLAELRSENRKSSPNKEKRSQLSLLAGAIKRKSEKTDNSTKKVKRVSDDEGESSDNDTSNAVAEDDISKSPKTKSLTHSSEHISCSSAAEDNANKSPSEKQSISTSVSSPKAESHKEAAEYVARKRYSSKTIECVAVLPGFGVYTDSSNSENDSDSDSDIEGHPCHYVPRDITGRSCLS